MKTNIVIDIPPPIAYLSKFSFSSYGPKCCQPVRLQGSLKCNISRKVNYEVYYRHAVNMKVFYKLILSLWICASRHTQSTQSKKFP